MDMKSVAYHWLQKPTVDPETNKKIKPFDFDYAELYSWSYDYLLKTEKLDKQVIREKMPKLHLLFDNQIDFLYFNENKADFDENTEDGLVYHFINEAFDRYGRIDPTYVDKSFNKYKIARYGPYENMVLYYAVIQFIEYVRKYTINFEDLLTCRDVYGSLETAAGLYDQFDGIKFLKVFCTRFGLYENLQKAIFSNWGTKNVNENIDSYEGKMKFDVIRPMFESSEDIFDTLLKMFEELYAMYYFKRNPLKSPFENLGELKKIEDPLVTIFKQIHPEKHLYKYLRLTDADLKTPSPVSSRSLSNSISQSHSISQSSRSSPSSGSSPGSSRRRSSSQTTKSYNSQSSLTSPLQIDKNALRQFKKLINLGIVDLLKKAKMPTNHTGNEFITLDTLDREYFNQNVLFSDDSNPKKCNYNVDPITLEEFSNKNYPLAKLQLMYTLHTKDDSNNIKRTDCFYAPTFYNYVVTEVKRQRGQDINTPVLFNPVTKAIISDDDIDRLVNIIRVVKPTANHPLKKKAFDKYLKLDVQKPEIGDADKQFYDISVVRQFARMKYTICKVCIIPDNDLSLKCINVLQQLFDKQILLHLYTPPYFINKQQYLQHPDILYYNNKSKWLGNARTKLQKLQSFIELLESLYT
jgi:hypothetical protein